MPIDIFSDFLKKLPFQSLLDRILHVFKRHLKELNCKDLEGSQEN